MITVAALGFLGEPIPGQGFWLSWLDAEDAKLVWAAREQSWKEVCWRFGIARTTAWRDPGDIHGAAEVALVLGSGEPACLAGGFAGRSAGGGRAVTLVTAVTRVGTDDFN